MTTTSTNKQGTWIKLSDLAVGDELNDGTKVVKIIRRTVTTARIQVDLTGSIVTNGTEVYTYKGRNVLVVR